MEVKPIPLLTNTTETEADVMVPAENIKQEPAVEQEYFEDVAQGQSERQSSDLSQSCADIQTDRDCSTELDSQAENSAFEPHRKKHRREATKRQRSLKKRIKSKYKNINSGAFHDVQLRGGQSGRDYGGHEKLQRGRSLISAPLYADQLHTNNAAKGKRHQRDRSRSAGEESAVTFGEEEAACRAKVSPNSGEEHEQQRDLRAEGRSSRVLLL